VHRLHEVTRRLAVGQVLLRRVDEKAAGRPSPEGPPRDRPEDRAITWELPQTGPARSWAAPSPANGLVFFGEDSGALMAVNASSGTPLWHFQTNTLWKASPMT